MNRVVSVLLVSFVFFAVWLGLLVPAGASIAFPDFYPAAAKTPDRFINQFDVGPVALNYYPVQGNTLAELRQSINHNRRSGWDAYTEWQVYWDWPGRGSTQCDLKHARLVTSLSLSFPERSADEEVSPIVLQRWNAYVNSLATHERSHLDNARYGFARMRQILRTASCDTAESELQAVIVSMREFDEAYDARTHHGADQGAVFP